jgi:hypothetical protein
MSSTHGRAGLAADKTGIPPSCLRLGGRIAEPRIDALEWCPRRNARLRCAPRAETHEGRTPKRPRGPSTWRVATGSSSPRTVKAASLPGACGRGGRNRSIGTLGRAFVFSMVLGGAALGLCFGRAVRITVGGPRAQIPLWGHRHDERVRARTAAAARGAGTRGPPTAAYNLGLVHPMRESARPSNEAAVKPHSTTAGERACEVIVLGSGETRCMSNPKTKAARQKAKPA